MNYIGSKDRLLNGLFSRAIASLEMDPSVPAVFGDAFAGTHAVGRFMQAAGWKVRANDNLYMSYAIGFAQLAIEPPAFESLAGEMFPVDLPREERLGRVLSVLNTLVFTDQDRWFYDNFCEEGAGGRLYLSKANGLKVQAARWMVESWNLPIHERMVLVASIVQAADKVANTASVYYTYLKQLKASAKKPIVFLPPATNGGLPAMVTCMDVTDFAAQIRDLDVLYLDPPYNHRQYAPNYHFLETLARWDAPEARGKGGVRPYENLKSTWCSKREALASLDALLAATDAPVVLLSYSDEGIMKIADIISTMGRYGNVTTLSEELPRFRSDKDSAKRQYTGRATIVESIYVLDRRASGTAR